MKNVLFLILKLITPKPCHFKPENKSVCIQNGNLIKVYLWEKGKMANVMLEILQFFFGMILMYRHSKSASLQVTLNFEFQ